MNHLETARSNKPKLFVLGNNYFPQLTELYEVQYADQAKIVATVGIFSNLRNYFRIINFYPDILFICDDSLPPLYSGVEKLPIPIVAYLIDTHLHKNWHSKYSKIFDHTFVAQKNQFQTIAQDNNNLSFLPLFAPGDLLLPDSKRDIDISFVGNLNRTRNPERVDFITEFKKHLPLQTLQGGYQEIFNRSRIILNQSVRDDINFRVFEAMSCGGMLLTDNVENGLDKLFTDGIHLVLYKKGDVADAVEKGAYYLEHESERRFIAKTGYLETIRKHTSQSRVVTLHKVFQKLLFSKTPDLKIRSKWLKDCYLQLAKDYENKILWEKSLAEQYKKLAETV